MEEQGVLNEIWRLPVHYRNVVYLYYYEKYTVHEIAKILEIKDNTISSWLTRARKKLKNMLLEGGYALDS
jgi:RNA polymerase sigma-70 factor (ECF subfamily)